MLRLESGVGPHRRNRPIDVGLVQDLLNLAMPGETPLTWDGVAGTVLYLRVAQFQHTALQWREPDEAVDPMGRTFQALTEYAHETSIVPWHRQGAEAYPGSCYVNPDSFVHRFVKLFGEQFEDAQFNGEKWYPQVTVGLTTLVGFIERDPAIGDIRWVAYMLATAWWETGHSFDPATREKGRGAGQPYGKPHPFTDKNGTIYPNNIYYGRGWVQLTSYPYKGKWVDNYLKIGKEINYGEKLAIDPDMALKSDIAYKVMSHGMRHGSFTGVGLARFIAGTKCDYYNARRIINAMTDHEKNVATYIATMAAKIEMLLRLATI